MRPLTPEQEAYCSRLPEWQRIHYRHRASRMSDRDREIERVTWDVGDAMKAKEEGRQHWRLNYDPVIARAERDTAINAYLASFYPELPRIHMSEPWGIPHAGLSSRDLNT